MIKELDSYDWKEAFGYAGGEPDAHQNSADSVPEAAVDGDDVDLTPFGREHVAEVFGMDEGENDGASWVIFGRLHDGRYFALSAGCDYTGWD